MSRPTRPDDLAPTPLVSPTRLPSIPSTKEFYMQIITLNQMNRDPSKHHSLSSALTAAKAAAGRQTHFYVDSVRRSTSRAASGRYKSGFRRIEIPEGELDADGGQVYECLILNDVGGLGGLPVVMWRVWVWEGWPPKEK